MWAFPEKVNFVFALSRTANVIMLIVQSVKYENQVVFATRCDILTSQSCSLAIRIALRHKDYKTLGLKFLIVCPRHIVILSAFCSVTTKKHRQVKHIHFSNYNVLSLHSEKLHLDEVHFTSVMLLARIRHEKWRVPPFPASHLSTFDTFGKRANVLEALFMWLVPECHFGECFAVLFNIQNGIDSTRRSMQRDANFEKGKRISISINLGEFIF